MSTTEAKRRRDALAYARRKARLRRDLRRGATCKFRKGRYGLCNGVIRDVVDRLGRVTPTCDKCDRRERGVCQRCPRPVAGKVGWSYYCASCKKAAAADWNRRWVQHNRKRKNASVRAYRKRQQAKREAVCQS